MQRSSIRWERCIGVPMHSKDLCGILRLLTWLCSRGESIGNPLGQPNLYIANLLWRECRIYKMDKQSTITTIAGTGQSGFSGDGGQARNARLAFPQGIVADGHDNVYFRDTCSQNFPWMYTMNKYGTHIQFDENPSDNSCIRKITKAGVVTTIANFDRLKPRPRRTRGKGMERLAFPEGLAIDPEGSLYAAQYWEHVIHKANRSGVIATVAGVWKQGYSGDGGRAIRARLSSPSGIASDSEGNLFVADYGNRCIRMVDRHGIITTVVSDRGRFTPLNLVLRANGSFYYPY